MMQEAYARCANMKRDSPWNLVIGFDEYVPGSKFLVDTNRKAMNLSFNFIEVGSAVLSHVFSWFTPVSIRTKVMAKVPGGWSQLLRRFLHLQLLGPDGLETAGVPIMLHGSCYLLKAKLKAMISDGDGHRSAFQWRGASGIRPCFRCANVLKLNSNLAHRRRGYVEIDCDDPHKFRLLEKDELFDMVDSYVEAVQLHADGQMSNGKLTNIGSACGLNVTKDGLLADKTLRNLFDPLRCMRYDWVHTCLQAGLVNTATTLFIRTCLKKVGIQHGDWERYLKDKSWNFPKAYSTQSQQLHRVFNSYRLSDDKKADDKVKARPSEMLGLYGLLRHFVETKELPPSVNSEVEEFLAACKIIGILLAAKRHVVPLAECATMLRGAVSDFLVKHKKVYGKYMLTPKVHWMFDVADQIEIAAADGENVILDAFVIERVHLRVKSHAQHIHNTTHNERTVLAGVVNEQHEQVQVETQFANYLYGKKQRVSETVIVSSKMDIESYTITVGDVVFSSDIGARVVACDMWNQEPFVMVDILPLANVISNHSVELETGNTIPDTWWRIEKIRLALAWYEKDADSIIGIMEF